MNKLRELLSNPGAFVKIEESLKDWNTFSHIITSDNYKGYLHNLKGCFLNTNTGEIKKPPMFSIAQDRLETPLTLKTFKELIEGEKVDTLTISDIAKILNHDEFKDLTIEINYLGHIIVREKRELRIVHIYESVDNFAEMCLNKLLIAKNPVAELKALLTTEHS